MKNISQNLAIAIVALLPSGALAEWQGAYAGASLGGISGQPTLGGFAVVQGQLQSVVFGAELGYSVTINPDDPQTPQDLSVADFTTMNLRLGYDFGDTMTYIGYGGAGLSAKGNNIVGDDAGLLFSIGLDYRINENTVVGGRYDLVVPIFNSIFTGDEYDLNAVSLRVAYQF